jgi:hypothetical protein
VLPRRLDGDRPLHVFRQWKPRPETPGDSYWSWGYECRLCGLREDGWRSRALAADYARQHIRKIEVGGAHDRFPVLRAIIDVRLRIGRRLTVVDCRTDFRPWSPVGLRIGDQVRVEDPRADLRGRAIVAGFHAPVSEPSADLTYLWVDWKHLTGPVGRPPHCSAHGEPACPACSQNPPAPGNWCCETWAESGMHGDTCAHRVRAWPVTGVAGEGMW